MNQKKDLLIRHLTISLVVFGVLFIVFSLFLLPFIQNISTGDPQTYFVIVFVSLILVCVLISYVVYLLLTSKTRAELLSWEKVKELAVSKEEFVRLYESAPVPYIMLNKKGEIQSPNKAALRFFGVLPEEIEGKVLFTLTSKEDTENGQRLFQFYKSNLPINKEELRMITKNGGVKWAALSVFDMRSPVDNSRIGLATILDITEEKKLSQAKTEFVSLASHQLRSPLATLKWYSDILLSSGTNELSPKQKEYTTRIHDIIGDMVELVNTLLNVSRMEIGSFVVEKKSTDVQELCESILLELSSQIDKKKIEVIKQYGTALKKCDTDPKLLRIIIQNLVSNAVKYTPEGGTVTIALEESGENKIVVSDTGLGIPKAQQDRIFTKLFRADNVAGVNNNESSGLGLYLVKSIVDTMGGDISFVSEENKGSAFTITF
jgi:PAS domain S-box-containing protein